jgi:hypothetical protein
MRTQRHRLKTTQHEGNRHHWPHHRRTEAHRPRPTGSSASPHELGREEPHPIHPSSRLHHHMLHKRALKPTVHAGAMARLGLDQARIVTTMHCGTDVGSLQPIMEYAVARRHNILRLPCKRWSATTLTWRWWWSAMVATLG